MSAGEETVDRPFDGTHPAFAGSMRDFRWTEDDRYVAWTEMIFTDRIVIGRGLNYYDDGWCYERGKAAGALEEWASRGYAGEPEGWHRHPTSGRRRPGGDAGEEEVNP